MELRDNSPFPCEGSGSNMGPQKSGRAGHEQSQSVLRSHASGPRLTLLGAGKLIMDQGVIPLAGRRPRSERENSGALMSRTAERKYAVRVRKPPPRYTQRVAPPI